MVKTFALGYDKNLLLPLKSRKMLSSCRAGWHLGSPRPRFSRSQPAPPSSPPCSPTTRSPPRSRRGWVTSGGSPRGPLSSWCTWWPCTPEHTSVSPTSATPSVVLARQKRDCQFPPSHHLGRRATTEGGIQWRWSQAQCKDPQQGRLGAKKKGGWCFPPRVDPFPPLGHTLTTYTNTYIYIYLQTRTKKIQRRGEYKSRRVSPFPPLCPSLTRVILFLVLPPYHHPSPSPFGQISKVFHLFFVHF